MDLGSSASVFVHSSASLLRLLTDEEMVRAILVDLFVGHLALDISHHLVGVFHIVTENSGIQSWCEGFDGFKNVCFRIHAKLFHLFTLSPWSHRYLSNL